MDDRVSILLVGDSLESFPDIGKIADHLGIELLHAITLNEALVLCGNEAVSMLVVDASSTDFQHTEVINTLRGNYDVSQIPMILLGGEPGDFLARSADEAPLDYVPGNMVPHLLMTRIRLMTEWYDQRRRIAILDIENERLDTVNKQVRKFVGNVAHDLRGPLGKLINTAEVLLSGVDPDAVITFYEMIAQTSRRAFNLVNDILDITALESGQLQLYFDKCDLGDVAAQVIEELDYLATRKDLVLENQVPLKLWVRADRRRLYQIFGNLVNNGIKFTPRGGRIVLGSSQNDGTIEVVVADTGIGISPDRMHKLFKKHIKNSTPGTEGEPGTGFGLPLAQEIAMAHNTTIEVKSEEGKGTRFTLKLASWSG